MGFLLALGVQIVRAIKEKKIEKKMSPEAKYMRDNPLNEKDKENFLTHIDYCLKTEYKSSVEILIDVYISHHSKDEDIIKRIDLMNKMEDDNQYG
jgi:hypothetical protein